MGRKSKLTDQQWAEVQKRVLAEEVLRDIAKDYGITEAGIRKKLGSQTSQIKIVANQIVTTERALSALPIGAQISAQNYASRLRALSDDMLEGATYSAGTFRKLSAIAHTEMMKVDETNPEKSDDVLRRVAAMTALANEAAKTPVNLIAANKETMRESDASELRKAKKVPTLSSFYGE